MEKTIQEKIKSREDQIVSARKKLTGLKTVKMVSDADSSTEPSSSPPPPIASSMSVVHDEDTSQSVQAVLSSVPQSTAQTLTSVAPSDESTSVDMPKPRTEVPDRNFTPMNLNRDYDPVTQPFTHLYAQYFQNPPPLLNPRATPRPAVDPAIPPIDLPVKRSMTPSETSFRKKPRSVTPTHLRGLDFGEQEEEADAIETSQLGDAENAQMSG
ncbi:MAG: hypothetical protein M1835_003897, partial [Candelina submexicana]